MSLRVSLLPTAPPHLLLVKGRKYKSKKPVPKKHEAEIELVILKPCCYVVIVPKNNVEPPK